MRFLLLLFIVVPVVEMWLLIQVGSVIGALPTIALVLLTAMIGVALLRREGLKTLLRGNEKLESGELPAQEMLEGMILAVSGALLLTPGFATDFAGFLGLIPWSRRWLAAKLLSSAKFQTVTMRGAHFSHQDQGQVFEAEYWQEEKRHTNTLKPPR